MKKKIEYEISVVDSKVTVNFLNYDEQYLSAVSGMVRAKSTNTFTKKLKTNLQAVKFASELTSNIEQVSDMKFFRKIKSKIFDCTLKVNGNTLSIDFQKFDSNLRRKFEKTYSFDYDGEEGECELSSRSFLEFDQDESVFCLPGTDLEGDTAEYTYSEEEDVIRYANIYFQVLQKMANDRKVLQMVLGVPHTSTNIGSVYRKVGSEEALIKIQNGQFFSIKNKSLYCPPSSDRFVLVKENIEI